jgi:hypothetical protein
MDDFSVNSLYESKNVLVSRLVNILTPLVQEGVQSISDEANKLCRDNGEDEKHLATLQTFLTRIPSWNTTIIQKECARMIEKSGCSYLEDLVTAAHIIELKLLTAIRAGQKQKKIELTIPSLTVFIHKTYIYVARKMYQNIYLLRLDIPKLNIQKNARETEVIVRECILNSIRESIPIEDILRIYMNETIEEDVEEIVKTEVIENPKAKKEKIIENELKKEVEKNNQKIKDIEEKQIINLLDGGTNETFERKSLSFSDVDFIANNDGTTENISAPKDIDSLQNKIKRLESESFSSNKDDENDEDDKNNVKLIISDINEEVDLDNMEILENFNNDDLLPDLIDDIEVLN